MELYKRYRPSDLEHVVGQDTAIKVLKQKIKANSVPHAILLIGPSGVGKTTIARALRKPLKCHPSEFHEVNCADIRGIDNIREIRRRMGLRPMNGQTKIWLIDECFIRNTMVHTPQGLKTIQTLHPGDQIYSAAGMDEVTHTFEKRIPLSRLVCVLLSDGGVLYCSDHHQFYTDTGWKFAKDLSKNDLTFSFDSNILSSIFERTEDEMSSLSARVPAAETDTTLLQQEVCNVQQVSERKQALSRVRTTDDLVSSETGEVQQAVLQQTMLSQEQDKTSRDTRSPLQQANSSEDKHSPESIPDHEGRFEVPSHMFQADEGTQPNVYTERGAKDDRYEGEQRDTVCVLRNQRRERDVYKATGTTLESTGEGVASGIADQDISQVSLSIQLQSRYRKSQPTDSDRGRRPRSSLEEEYTQRCKEAETSNLVRVVRVSYYEPGNRDVLFDSVVSAAEAEQGFLTLYDVGVRKHPSYFVGFTGILVHNCHKLTNDAQNALLKMLEDTPDHVYFMLATTEPNKVIRTIHTRCLPLHLKPVGEKDLTELVMHTYHKEVKDGPFPETAIEKIVEHSDGSARQALVLLDSVIGLASEEEMLEAIEKSTLSVQAIQLCRLLLNPRTGWQEIAKMLKDLEGEDPEGLRRMVLGYMRSVLLGGSGIAGRAGFIIGMFERNFFDSGNSGLALACWETMTRK